MVSKASSQGGNWNTHDQGIRQLIQLRGPELHTSGYGHQIYVWSRLAQFIAAFMARKATPFADEEWISIPWKLIPKTLKHELLDIMMLLPGLLEMIDTAQEQRCGQAPPYVWSLYGDLDAALQSWYAIFIVELGAPTISTGDAEFAEIRPDFFLAHGLDVAHTAVLYWAACLVLHSAMRVLVPAESSPTRNNEAFAMRSDPRPYALNIVFSAPYFFQPDAGLGGAMAFAFSAAVAMNYLAKFDPEGLELRERLRDTLRDAIENLPAGPLIGAFFHRLAAKAVPPLAQMKVSDRGGDNVRVEN